MAACSRRLGRILKMSFRYLEQEKEEGISRKNIEEGCQ
jgi:hypothetical protein